MKKKRKISSIIFSVFLLLAVGIVVYFFFFNESENSGMIGENTPASTPSVTPISIPVNWQNLISEIRGLLGPKFLDVAVEEFGPLNISEEKDITGDGVTEALVDLGSGGAYTGYLTLMRFENRKPTLTQFKQEDGAISPMLFLEGASVMNGEAVEMLPEKNAIYSGHWSRSIEGEPFGSLTDCGVEAYRWNAETKIFEFDKNLSGEIRPDFCQKAESVQ